MDRRDFLTTIGLSLIGGKFLYDLCASVHRSQSIEKIYNELLYHVHIAETFSVIKAGSLEMEGKVQGCGVVMNGKYLTMAHIIIPDVPEFEMLRSLGIDVDCKVKGEEIKKDTLCKVLRQETTLYGSKIECLVLDRASDVAIFDLSKELKGQKYPKDPSSCVDYPVLPPFPCKPSNEIALGDEVYIIGNPFLEGPNIRKAQISNLYGTDTMPGCFGIDHIVIPGDSGCPVVNSELELLGLCYAYSHGLGYVKKISNFTKYLKGF